MLLENCSIEMNVAFSLEKGDKRFSATAFPKVIGDFLEEDIYAYSKDTSLLEEKDSSLKMLTFSSQMTKKLITSMAHHTVKQAPNHDLLKVNQQLEQQQDAAAGNQSSKHNINKQLPPPQTTWRNRKIVLQTPRPTQKKQLQ